MKRNFKRVISMLLCAAMVVGFLPAIAHVAHATTESGKFNPVLIQEDFETATDSGIPAGWLGYSEIGLNNKIDGTNSFTTDGEDNYYKITYTGSEEETHLAGRHHGIGKITSVANTGGHAKIRLTAKVWTNSTANLISRFDYVVNGVPQPYQNVTNSQVNSTINETTKPAVDNFMREFDLSNFTSGTDVQLVLMQLRNQTSELYLDDVKLEYVHSYTLNRDSGIPVDANDPECVKNFIKCDHCDALKKDDAYATGVDFIYTNGILTLEDFETVDPDDIPEGWLPATDGGSSTNTKQHIGYVEGADNNTFKISGKQANGTRTGVAIPVNVSGSNGHTKVRYSVNYSGEGSMISRVYTGTGSAYVGADSYNVTSNINQGVANDNGLREYTWTIVDNNGAYVYGTYFEVRLLPLNASAEFELDDIRIEYIHTYTMNRDSGVAANAYANYICCDHCKALKKDDSSATGAVTVISDPSTLAYDDFAIEDPQGIPEGWYAVTAETPSGTPNTVTANIGYESGTYKLSGRRNGVAIPFSVANNGGHTAIRYTFNYTTGNSGADSLISRIFAGSTQKHQQNQPQTTEKGFRNETWDFTGAGTDFQLRIYPAADNNTANLNDIHITYVHTYTNNRDSGIAANAYSNYIKCDHCDALKINDPYATGSNVIYKDNYVLFHDDFNTADASGIPGSALFANAGISTYGTESPAADFGYVDGAYKITGNRTGIAIPVSLANSNGHAQIVVTAKYAGSGLMISRVSAAGPNSFVTGVNANTTAANEGGTRKHTVNLADASGATSLYVVFVPNAAGYDILLDEIHVAYVHTYTQNRDSGIAANAHSNWICCDHCDMLKKDDPTASGSLTLLASNSTLVYEDFEIVDPQGIPEGWMSALDTSSSAANVPSAYVGYVEGDSNNTYKISGKVSSARTGIAIPISVANNNGHTKVRYSVAYSGEGSMISRVYTGTGSKYITKDDYNKDSNLNWGVTTDNGLRTYEWTIMDAEGNYPYGTDLQVRFLPLNNVAEFELDNVLVEYVHTYNDNRQGTEASNGVYYIKCDHCDALKVNDPHATGDIYVDGTGATAAVNISKTTVNFGENLTLKFAFKKSDIANASGYNAVVKIDDETVEIPSTKWISSTINSEAYWIVAAAGLAAKEMDSSVEIYIADAEGNKISTAKATSLRKYAESRLENSTNDLFKTVVVDMLNYGAAAQNHFNHDTESLANRNLTAEQQNLATKEQDVNFAQVTSGTSGVSATVSFENDIYLKFKPADTTATIAVITYTPYNSSQSVTKTVKSSGGIFSLVGLVVADYETQVNAKFYVDADAENPVAEVTYSLQQYASNKKANGSGTMQILAVEFAKFSTSAREYLLSK